MRFWPFGAAVVFLAAVLISACNSYPLGNMSKIEGKWTTPRRGRQREPYGTKRDRLYLSRQKREKGCVSSRDGCCTKCPRGTFLNNCTCETCGDDTYLAYENHLGSCFSCDTCTSDDHQVAVEECAPEHNRKCGCQRGYYRINDNEVESKYFSCEPCLDCASLNKQTQTNCSESLNAQCGECLPNYKLQGDKCQKMISDNATQTPDLKNSGFNPAYLLLCLPCLLLFGAPVIYYKRRCITGQSSPAGIHTLVNSACIDTLLAAAAPTSSPKHKSEEPTEFPSSSIPLQVQSGLLRADPTPHRLLLQGRKMYCVIDAVPVRRWKEFMRGLGLRDGEIEAVEVEHTQLREQQYEMLKRWRQQQGTTLDAIFAVLEDMQLGGCAQELREQLQPSHLLPSL